MNRDNPPATVLVTGAGHRLGRTIALDLARAGWQVGVHYHTASAEAESLVATIEGLGGNALALQANLARQEELVALVQACAERLGTPVCLINNAARFERDSIFTLDAAGWQAHLDLNLRAPVFLTQAFARTLPEDALGHVINIVDQRVWRLTPDYFSYTIAKSALWTATQTLAQALAPRIRVNAIAPGPVLPSRHQSPADFEREWRISPLQRAVAPEEVSAAIRFLLASPSVTGQLIALDSGQHLAWDRGSDEDDA